VDVAIALDIGGTKIEAGIVDVEGSIRWRRQAATPADDPWPTVADLVQSARHASDEPPKIVGVGCGGPMRLDGELVSPLNIVGWRDFPLKDRLRGLTKLPVAIDNDAKALALGEGWRGAARGYRDFIAMVVSTGVGGGIVLDGHLLDGAQGNCGHIGHVIVEPEGRLCACGARGCLEAEASGPAIAAASGGPTADAPTAVIERTGRLVGRALASVVNLLDLRLAVVAGSVALGFGAPFFAAAQGELDASARIEFARGARVVPAGLGADGPLVGAAAVAWRAAGLLPDFGPSH
jgi:glucokinase